MVLAQLSSDLALHFLTSYSIGQGFYVWNRVRLLPKLVQGEGLMPGSQGDPAGTRGNPCMGFRVGACQACSVSLSCVPWLPAGPRNGLVSSEQFRHTCPMRGAGWAGGGMVYG